MSQLPDPALIEAGAATAARHAELVRARAARLAAATASVRWDGTGAGAFRRDASLLVAGLRAAAAALDDVAAQLRSLAAATRTQIDEDHRRRREQARHLLDHLHDVEHALRGTR